MDLSTAFETIDLYILLNRLEPMFDLSNLCLIYHTIDEEYLLLCIIHIINIYKQKIIIIIWLPFRNKFNWDYCNNS